MSNNLNHVLAYYHAPNLPQKVQLKPLKIEQLNIAPIGSRYLLELSVLGVTETNAQAALDSIIREFNAQFGIKTMIAEVSENKINLAIIGSPFAWTVLLAALPTILGLLGISLLGVSVWQIVTGIPNYVWGVLAMGLFTLYIGYKVFK